MRTPLPLLAFLSGACIYAEPYDAARSLDYRIDRPLVPAIRFDPPSLRPNQPVRIEALVLTPLGDAPATVSVDVCGLKEDALSQIWGFECFTEADLVDHIGSSLPVTWTPPDPGLHCDAYDTADGDTGWYLCASAVPILVQTTTRDGKTGRGGVQVDIPADGTPPAWDEPPPVLSVSAIGEPKAGGDVVLEVIVWNALLDESGVRWYIDAGELRGTGRTRNNGGEALYVSRNTLTIPEDWHGPLRVYAVGQTANGELPNMGWTSTVVEVP